MRIEIRNYYNDLLCGIDYPLLDMLTDEQVKYLNWCCDYCNYESEFIVDGNIILRQNNSDVHPELFTSQYIELVTRVVEYFTI